MSLTSQLGKQDSRLGNIELAFLSVGSVGSAQGVASVLGRAGMTGTAAGSATASGVSLPPSVGSAQGSASVKGRAGMTGNADGHCHVLGATDNLGPGAAIGRCAGSASVLGLAGGMGRADGRSDCQAFSPMQPAPCPYRPGHSDSAARHTRRDRTPDQAPPARPFQVMQAPRYPTRPGALPVGYRPGGVQVGVVDARPLAADCCGNSPAPASLDFSNYWNSQYLLEEWLGVGL